VRELCCSGFIDVLIQVVRGFVIARLDEVIEGFHLGRVGRPAEFEGESGDALSDEVDLIASDEAVFIGLFVELHFDVVELRDGTSVVAEGGLAQALNFEIVEREEGKEHVHVEVGYDVRFIDGGFGGEVSRAELAHLFRGERDKEDGAFGARACGEKLRGFNDGGYSGGVVHCAVVDGVSVDRLADAEVIKVRADDDELVFEIAVGAFELANYILCIDGRILRGDGGDLKSGVHVECG